MIISTKEEFFDFLVYFYANSLKAKRLVFYSFWIRMNLLKKFKGLKHLEVPLKKISQDL